MSRKTKRQDDVVKDSAATLTCAAETAGDFAYQCTHHQEALDLDLPYLQIAAGPSLHIHLDSIEHYRELVRSRLFAEPPTD